MCLFSWWISFPDKSAIHQLPSLKLPNKFDFLLGRRRLCDSNTRLEDFLLYHSPLSQYTNCFRWNVSSRTCFSGYDNRVYQTLTTISLKLCQNWMRFWSKLCHLCQTCYTPSQQGGGGRGREKSFVKCYKVTSAQHTSHNEVIGSNVNYSYVHELLVPPSLHQCRQRFSLQMPRFLWLIDWLNYSTSNNCFFILLFK